MDRNGTAEIVMERNLFNVSSSTEHACAITHDVFDPGLFDYSKQTSHTIPPKVCSTKRALQGAPDENVLR